MTERRRASSGSAWEPQFGYSRALRAGDMVFVAGTVGTNPDGRAAEGPYAQARRALEIIAAALVEVGASIQDVVRTRTFVTDIGFFPMVARAHLEVFGEVLPAASLMQVGRLIEDGYVVEIEVDAVVQSGPAT